MRLNKYIASCGAASRRMADEMIAAKRVTVNGALADSMGYDVDVHNDEVCLDGNPLTIENKHVYIMLNKPSGYISACTDDRGRKTVIDLIGGIDQRLFPVGRLDYDTEGLLLLTNDGDFSYHCTHPKHEVAKKYYAIVKGILSDSALQTLRGGVTLDGDRTHEALIDIIRRSSKRTELFITIHEGKNRQIKKMFQLAGCRVTYLKRVAMGNLTLGDLDVGCWRYLTPNEVDFFLNSSKIIDSEII